MSSTKSLNGFTPARKWGSGSNSTGTNQYDIKTGCAPSIFTGDLVHVQDGYVSLLSAFDGSVPPMGVFMGCRYEADGEPKWSGYWPTGTSATNARAYVVDDPFATFYLQADGAVSQGEIMQYNFEVTNTGGNTFTKRSDMGMDAASRVATAAAVVRPIGIKKEPGNAIGDAYPIVEVELLHHQLRITTTT